jgi:hypothetical protein
LASGLVLFSYLVPHLGTHPAETAGG